MRQDKRSASAGGPKPPSDHICSKAAPQVSLLHSACPALAPLVSLPPSLFRLCCWFVPTSAAGGHSLHCLAHAPILFYATSFFSASPDFMLVYPQ